MQGTVIGGSNNIFSVECQDKITRQCTIKGKKLKSAERFYNPLAPGDYVNVEPDEKKLYGFESKKNVFGFILDIAAYDIH